VIIAMIIIIIAILFNPIDHISTIIIIIIIIITVRIRIVIISSSS
jgi:hypothetical protein